MLLDKIVGQDEVIQRLKGLLKRKGIPSLIFYGKSGVGKRTTSIALARAINCDNGGCEVCSSCRELEKHPDIREIRDEQGYIKIDLMREVIKEAALRPTYKRRVYIIDNAHFLTQEASACLLKTLEESDALFILITNSINSLLPTIRSRCWTIRFKPLSKDAFRSLGIEDEGLIEISEGSMEKALNYCKIDIEEEKKSLSLWISELKHKGSFEMINRLLEREERLSLTIELLLFILKKKCLYSMINEVLKAKELILANVNRRLALENMVFKMRND